MISAIAGAPASSLKTFNKEMGTGQSLGSASGAFKNYKLQCYKSGEQSGVLLMTYRKCLS